MTTQELDLLAPMLEDRPLPAANITQGMPIPTFLAEAETLGKLLDEPGVTAALEAVGVAPRQLAQFPAIVRGCRQAQALWTQVRSQHNSPGFTETLAEAKKVRHKMLTACEWNLRDIASAQHTLSLIREGSSTADLAQDLHDLAALTKTHASAFARDQTYDLPGMAARARQLAEILIGEKAGDLHRFSKSEAKALRDRAFVFLGEQVAELRQAGDYAYLNDPDMAERFNSLYWKKYNRKPVHPEDLKDAELVNEILEATPPQPHLHTESDPQPHAGPDTQPHADPQ